MNFDDLSNNEIEQSKHKTSSNEKHQSADSEYSLTQSDTSDKSDTNDSKLVDYQDNLDEDNIEKAKNASKRKNSKDDNLYLEEQFTKIENSFIDFKNDRFHKLSNIFCNQNSKF